MIVYLHQPSNTLFITLPSSIADFPVFFLIINPLLFLLTVSAKADFSSLGVTFGEMVDTLQNGYVTFYVQSIYINRYCPSFVLLLLASIKEMGEAVD